jgi:hypothetical protein
MSNQIGAVVVTDGQTSTTVVTETPAYHVAVADVGVQGPPGDPGTPGPYPAVTPYRTNGWYGQPIVATTTYTPGEGVVLLNWLTIPARFAITSMLFEVTTAGAAGALARLGVYRLNTDNVGGVLEIDAGTVDVTTVGQIEIPCPVAAKAAPWMALPAIVCQGGAATRPAFRALGNAPQLGPFTRMNTVTAVQIVSFVAYTVAGLTAAPLPATFPTVNEGTQAPRILIRGTQS